MFGIVNRIRKSLGEVKTGRAAKIMLIALAFTISVKAKISYAQANTIDTTTFTDLLNALMPLIIALISIAIPLMFFSKIMQLIERLFRGFA